MVVDNFRVRLGLYTLQNELGIESLLTFTSYNPAINIIWLSLKGNKMVDPVTE